MTGRTNLKRSGFLVVMVSMLGISATVAQGQTPLPGGFEIALLAGFTHEPLQGFDSVVGRIAKKDGLQIQYEMGAIPAKGALRLGGQFVNQALQMPEKDRLWLKEQTAGGRTIHIAYGKNNLLIVTSASAKEGINFSSMAKTSGDVADVLLMALTFSAQKPKP